MKNHFSKKLKKGTRKAIALFLATFMSVSTVGMGTIQSRAEETSDSTNSYGLHNPRIAYNYRESVIFGHYWQEDTNGDGVADKNDDKQPIVWQVLERYTDGTALVLSDKVLDTKAFTNKWKESSLRTWLNGSGEGDFMKEAFSSDEQEAIKLVSLESYPNGYNGVINADYISEDKVFLLDYSDVLNLSYGFSDDKDYNDISRTAEATAYAEKSDSSLSGKTKWWLRSPYISNNNMYVMCVDNSGKVAPDGKYGRNGDYINDIGGVRPAMRINLSSMFITNGEDVKVSPRGSEWDTVSFGTYNGSELKWRVLNTSGDDALLLSDKVITSKAYNDTDTSITWENCNLRSWLNNDFIDEAFSETEKEMIRYTSILNPDNPYSGTEGGNDTTDRIFLLSLNDIIQPSYGFHSNYDRIAENSDCEAVWWWLRSPANSDNHASTVESDGIVYCSGLLNHKVDEIGGVRPALHINLKSSSWSKEDNVSVGDTSGAIEQEPYTGDSSRVSDENTGGESGGNGENSGGESGSNGGNSGGSGNNGSGNGTKPNNGNTSANVAKKAQNITGVKNITKVYSTKKFSLKAKTSGDGKLTFKSSNAKVAKVNSKGKITLVGIGKTKIIIKAAGTSKYKPAQKTIVLTVKAGKQKITSKVKSKTMEYTNKPFSLGTRVLGKAKVTYKSSDPKVLKVDSKGKVTLTGIGKATITIKTKKNKKYAAGTKKITINVTAPKLRLNCKAVQGKKVLLSWNASPVYDGYYVEIAYDSQFKDTVRGGVGSFNKGRSEAVISGFKTAGTKCYVHIRPYTKKNGKEIYYSWSKTETFIVTE